MKKVVLLFVFSFLFRLVLSFGTYHPDLRNHMDWGLRFWEYGPQKFYSANVWNYTWPNQPPGTIYIFAAIRKLYEFIFNFFWWINTNIPPFPSQIMYYLESNLYPALIKLPAILSDLGIALVIYKILKNMKKVKLAFLGAFVFLFNPVIWYNSAVWGQTDSTVNLLAIAAFYLLLKRRLLFSTLLFAISLYVKASLLIFLPIFVVVVWKQKYRLIEISNAIVVSFLTTMLFTLPFAPTNPHEWLFNIYKDKVFTQQLHVITANAFNIWASLTGIYERPDSLIFGPFTFQVWGYLLFAAAITLPLYKIYMKQNIETIFASLSITAFAGFMLLTNMHERYLYPLFPAFTIVAVTYKRLFLTYWVISFIELLNMYHLWWYPRIAFLVSVFEYGDKLLPRILGGVNLILFIIFYRKLLFIFRHKQASRDII